MADAGVQPYWSGHVGCGPHAQWPLRPALYLCDLWHGAVLHADGDWNVPAALEASGDSASLPLHGISVAAGDLRADRERVDAEHNHHTAYTGILGNNDRADRRAGIFVLEARQPESCLDLCGDSRHRLPRERREPFGANQIKTA